MVERDRFGSYFGVRCKLVGLEGNMSLKVGGAEGEGGHFVGEVEVP